MYAVRVLTGGDIFVVRVSDKFFARYRPDGRPVYGNMNKLNLDPEHVISLAEKAQSDWFAKYLHR